MHLVIWQTLILKTNEMIYDYMHFPEKCSIFVLCIPWCHLQNETTEIRWFKKSYKSMENSWDDVQFAK